MKRRISILCLLLVLPLLLASCVRSSGKGSAEITASARVGDFRVRLTSTHTVYDLDEVNPAHPLKIRLYFNLAGDDFGKTVWMTGDSWYSFSIGGIPDLYPVFVDEEASDTAPIDAAPQPTATALRMTKADQTIHIWQGESVVERLNEQGRRLEPGNYTVTVNIHFYLDEALTEPFFCSLTVPITLK